jgi:anion-transporting  ArsA/GET3 family ATPase
VSQSPLEEVIHNRRVIVCVGSGGVGKTTLAAALAVRAAVDGRKVCVCTIDPARRLANSLGLAELGNVETRVPEEKFKALGLAPKGTLFAMMLDLKRTWDDLVLRHVPPDRREAILQSRFYQQLSSALAGSQEYVAMEKLVELRLNRGYDLVVLDTPPTAHALDFLDAPNRVLDFFGDEKVRRLLAPALTAGRLSLKMFNLAGGYFVKTIGRITGLAMLEELAGFLGSLAPMYDVFKERAATVKELLGSPESAFVLVTTPNPLTVDESVYFHTLLLQDAMPVAAIVANRVHNSGLPRPIPAQSVDALAALLEGAPGLPGAPVQERLASALSDAQTLESMDAQEIERLQRECAPTPVVSVPRFESDVYDLAGLWELDRHLLGPR